MYPSKKLCLVLVYLGDLPSFFPWFIQSIQTQPFDFIIFSNRPPLQSLPDNVKWVPFTLSDFEERVRNKLAITPQIKHTYKLCDFKPAFGILFQDYLEPYEWWGGIDNDIILGNTNGLLEKLETPALMFYSSKPKYVSGAFFAMRNNQTMNRLFQKSVDWQTALENPEYVSFDECAKLWDALQQGASILDLPSTIYSFTHLLFDEQKKGMKTLFADDLLEPKGLNPVKIEKQKVTTQGREWIGVHLLYYKTRWYFHCNLYALPYPFYVNAYGTFKKQVSSQLQLSLTYHYWKAQAIRVMLKLGMIDTGFYKMPRGIRNTG